ncbi:DUF1345 domain-containing protein [Micromonospora sp. 4G57]|uniref:DUF1345 domain-containing protein n=1 Tax=Micromonospora sicca TaxID=2202420 RepID=A0ABU5JHI1_9ACTN|nr:MULTISPECIES: DUF1345 domain-containing protein [unclassified Micromonospora]MDZ5447493.1 DUF1345 domain-containing protein [Micromonospora sp. 4G57]MDZ5492036.1 DUF1345 domain-containing protein [Micromonospora sp. 4G53]
MRRTIRDPDGHTPAAVQLTVMGLVGVVCGGLFAALVSPPVGPLVGWDAAALSWLALLWSRLWRLDADRTARLAVHEDPNRPMRDGLLLGACLASLLAVGVVLTTAHSVPPGLPLDAYGALGVLSVVLSWFVVHTLFTARYARLYYAGEPGGVDFHQDEAPCYADFAYLAFTVGATFQVSDTDLCSAEMRRTVLRHMLLSYLFGAVIIAATVNLVVGLAR